MGLFLSFLGGAAEQFSEGLRKSEEEARTNAMLSVKAMTSNYEQVVKENMSLAKKLKEDEDFILSYHPNATPDQVRELLARPTVMDAFRKYKDPSSISLDSLVKISAGNPSAATAAERVAAFPDMVEKATAVAKTTMPKRVSPLGQIYDEFGEQAFTSAQNKALMQTAQALGISVEDLKSQRRLERPAARGTVDMSVFAEPKKIADELNNAQVALLDAKKSGSPQAIEAAQSYVNLVAETAKNPLTSPQQEFANRVADLKQKATGTDPAAAQAAEKELQKIWALEKREKEAKKTTGEKAAEGKVPALGSLNTITGAAVIGGLQAKYGPQIRDGKIAVTADANGNVNIVPMVATEEGIRLRKQMAEDSVRIAQNTLSRYILNGVPINDEVATVMNRWQAAVEFAGEVPAAQPADQGQQRPARIAPPAGASAQPARSNVQTPATSTTPRPKPANAPADAKLAPDGHWYSQDPQTKKYIKWSN